jgi:CelD/BcsL family acetyltransferase involved in cellulose biosynthesis
VTADPLTLHDEAIERLQAEWIGLLATCREQIPFVTPAWQQVWLRHFQSDRSLHAFSIRDGERLVGVIPLLYDGNGGEFVGHYSICDYLDGCVTPGFERSVMESVLRRTASDRITSLDLRGLREDSPLLEAIIAVAQSSGYGVQKEHEAVSPKLDLPGSWDEYLSRLSKKDRHEMRRKMRRLESAGKIELRIVTTAQDADPLLVTLFRLMRASNHHKEEFLDRPGMQEFFRDMVATMANAGMLRFHVLELDGVCVAMVLNLDVGGVLYMYNSGYDPEYSHYAVGLMSKALLIRDAIENGRTCVDFMRGDESYKYDLGGQDRHVYRLLLTKA